LLAPERRIDYNPATRNGTGWRTLMANTKNITDPAERKSAKRKQRAELVKVQRSLTTKQRSEFRKSETVGVRAWMAEQQAEAEE